MSKNIKKEFDLFKEMSESFLNLDPGNFVKNNLTIDGMEFNILDNGWKFMADIYRYIAHQATQKDGKPVVIKKGRQVGATMMAGALDLFFTNSGLYTKPPIRVVHCFPALAHVKRFSQDKLEGLVRTAKDDFINKNKLTTGNAVDNLTMKQFQTGTLWVESLGTDGDRIRGMTADVVFFDEVQDMFPQAIGNAQKILTASKYGPTGKGVQVFFGTPKQRNSYFSTIWEMSDQKFYHLGCDKCKTHYPFYLPDDKRWMDIWVSGYDIKCPNCGAISKKSDAIDNGKWVSTKKNSDNKFVGYHINQLYIPYFTKENILDLMPEQNPSQSERIWNNEVVGEFYSGYGMPLTKGDIYKLCRDANRQFSRSIDSRDKPTYLGLDWGGKSDAAGSVGGKSYSCAVVLSALPDGTLLIEHAHKLSKNTYDYKKDTVNEMFRRFGIKRAVSDWFYGQDVVHDLQLRYSNRFIGAQGSGSLSKPVRFREDEMILSYNKDLMIEEIFDLFRKGKIRFPWKSYEYVEWLIDHCTSMEVKQRTVAGNPMKTYVKGPAPNDGLMALMYAYMAYKFDITKGYSVKPGFEKEWIPPTASIAKVRF